MLDRRVPPMLVFGIAAIFLMFAFYQRQQVATITSNSKSTSAMSLSNQHNSAESTIRIRNDYIELFINTIMNVHYNFFPGYIDGNDVPPHANALSMVGKRRLDNFAMTVATAIKNGISGDIIETGSWRGGASFVAAKVIDILEPDGMRKVYICDSFKGIPPPPSDREYHKEDHNANFPVFSETSPQRLLEDAVHFGLKPDSIKIVEGFFNESLPALLSTNPTLTFSVLRLDGDTYFSTMDALNNLYPRLSEGGFVIIDDYIDWVSCRAATDDYRKRHGITDPIVMVPHKKGEILRGAYWRKGSAHILREYFVSTSITTTSTTTTTATTTSPISAAASSYLCLGTTGAPHTTTSTTHSSVSGEGSALAPALPTARKEPLLYPTSSLRPQTLIPVPPTGPPGLSFDTAVFMHRTGLLMCV